MFRLLKQVFIALLSVSWSLATKSVTLSNEPCMIRPTFIDVNLYAHNYYPFMIGLDKCNGSCNVDNLSKNYMVCKKH